MRKTGVQRFDPDALDGGLERVMAILAGSPGGLSHPDPAGGLVGGALEAVLLDKGFGYCTFSPTAPEKPW